MPSKSKSTAIAACIGVFALCSAAGDVSAQAPAQPQAQPAQRQPGTTTTQAQPAQPARPGTARGPERGRMFDDWGIECETQADRRELCFAQQTHTSRENGQRILSISFGYIGPNNAPMLVAFTPLGVNVAAGAALRIDQTPQIPMAIQTCLVEGCRATAAITPDQVRALSAARTLTLGVIPFGSDQTTTIAVSVRGLTAAMAHLRPTP